MASEGGRGREVGGEEATGGSLGGAGSCGSVVRAGAGDADMSAVMAATKDRSALTKSGPRAPGNAPSPFTEASLVAVAAAAAIDSGIGEGSRVVRPLDAPKMACSTSFPFAPFSGTCRLAAACHSKKATLWTLCRVASGPSFIREAQVKRPLLAASRALRLRKSPVLTCWKNLDGRLSASTCYAARAEALRTGQRLSESTISKA